jgi:ABC-type Zn2+ transport system substrate-binding protein/surface adhesin
MISLGRCPGCPGLGSATNYDVYLGEKSCLLAFHTFKEHVLVNNSRKVRIKGIRSWILFMLYRIESAVSEKPHEDHAEHEHEHDHDHHHDHHHHHDHDHGHGKFRSWDIIMACPD